MDNLKEYLKKYDNSSFDEELPSGDEERFEGMYEMYRNRVRFQSSVKRRKKAFWKVALIPVAASLALLLIMRLFLNPFMKEEPTMSIEGMTADQVYQQYLEELNIRTNEIIDMTDKMSEDEVVFAMQTLQDIVRENRPFPELLSDDISETEKAEAVQAFAQRNLEAVDEYKSLLAEAIK